MTIKYNLTKLDLIRANVGLMMHNRFLMGFVIVTVLFLGWLDLNRPEIINRSLGFIIFYLFIYCLFFAAFLFAFVFVVSSISILIRQNKGLIGEHILTITPEGLQEKTEFNETLFRWTAFHKIRVARNYVIIYVTETSIYVVPKRPSSIEGNLEEFIADLKEKTKNIQH